MRLFFSWLLIAFIIPAFCEAQDNYEIQVYGSETVPKGNTMVELHSNFTFDGSKQAIDGVLPTNHVFHETIEITHGWTPWFETGFYFFNAIGNNNRTAFVGSHIRPRVMVPKEWNWPVGVSLSLEAGYQKKEYSEDDWNLEIRPIVDKQFNKLYLAFNPTFDKSFHGANKELGYVFSPNLKAAYNITKVVATGFEYYGSIGPLNNFQPLQSQQHQLFIDADLDWSPDWELNFGYGWGFTQSTDNDIFKVILGYRFHK
jgi:outer membrane receptor protein involved in Fe transport